MNDLTSSHHTSHHPLNQQPPSRGTAFAPPPSHPHRAVSTAASSSASLANVSSSSAASSSSSSSSYHTHPYMKRFPGVRTDGGAYPTNEYNVGPYNTYAPPPHQLQHQPQQPLKDRGSTRAPPPPTHTDFKFDPIGQEQYTPTQAATPYSYAWNYPQQYQQQQQQQAPQQQQQQQQALQHVQQQLSHTSVASLPQQQQQYPPGGYGTDNALGMLVSSATQPADAMPHDPNKDDRAKYRSYTPQDAYLSSGGGGAFSGATGGDRSSGTISGAGMKVPLAVLTPHPQYRTPQSSTLYGNSNPYYTGGGGGGGPSAAPPRSGGGPPQGVMELLPPSAAAAAMTSTYDSSNSDAGQRGYSMGLRMGSLPSGSVATLSSRLKDTSPAELTGNPNSGGGAYNPQAASSDGGPKGASHQNMYAPPPTVMSEASGNTSGSGNNNPTMFVPMATQGDVCSLCLGVNSDKIVAACGHRFHSGCLQDWGEKATCPFCMPPANLITNLHHSASALNYSIGAASSQGEGAGESSSSTMSLQSMQFKGPPRPGEGNGGTRPPPIDTRLGDVMLGNAKRTPSPSSGITSSTSGNSSSGRARKNKKLKDCSVPGCDRTVRSRGLCKGHGGGRRCGFAGCGLSDQGGGFCISHGGGKRCQHEGCDNSAQSRGLCKLHGGGSRCTVANCTKSSQGRGLCRAHGGGRRCMVEGCNKTDRRAGYCVTHGADKKCIVQECSKTGRIDNMCTKHYFERNEAARLAALGGTNNNNNSNKGNSNHQDATSQRERKKVVVPSVSAPKAMLSFGGNGDSSSGTQSMGRLTRGENGGVTYGQGVEQKNTRNIGNEDVGRTEVVDQRSRRMATTSSKLQQF